MVNISSTKKPGDFLYTSRVYSKILITTSYTLTTSWVNAPNWTLTIPQTGRYKIIASGVLSATESTATSNIPAFLRLAVGGIAINGTQRMTQFSMNAGTYVYLGAPFEVTWEDDFIVGQVVTLQGAYLTGAGNEGTITYIAGRVEPFMSYELVNDYIPAAAPPKRVQSAVNITSTYALGTAAAAITGWTITIPSTRRYKIKAQGSYITDDVDSSTFVMGTLELGLNGALINGTQIYVENNGVADFRVGGPFSIEYEGDFSMGDIITLRGQKLSAAGDLIEIMGSAARLARISYESVPETTVI